MLGDPTRHRRVYMGPARRLVHRQCFKFGNPVKIEGRKFRRHVTKLANVIAEEVDAWSTQPLQFADSSALYLPRIKIADEQVDRRDQRLPANEILNCPPSPPTPLLQSGPVIACKPLGPVDAGHFKRLVPRLLDSAQKVRPPEPIGGNSMLLESLQTANQHPHALRPHAELTPRASLLNPAYRNGKTLKPHTGAPTRPHFVSGKVAYSRSLDGSRPPYRAEQNRRTPVIADWQTRNRNLIHAFAASLKEQARRIHNH